MFFQHSLCGIEMIDCVKNLKVNYSKCYQSCEGLLVTNIQKLDATNPETLIGKVYDEYNIYQNNFSFPNELKGDNHIFMKHRNYL